MRPPEPCTAGRCWSPMACNGWGYCRERNADYPGGPTAEDIQALRDGAAARQADAEQDDGGGDGR